MTTCLSDSFNRLFDYVKESDYEGNDLYDGLNSELFKKTHPFNILYKNRFFRLCLIQFCKLSPINFRKLLRVPAGFNPKAGALFLLGNLNMFKKTGDAKYKEEAQKLYAKLKEVSIKRAIGTGWGYNFDWQARAFFVPIGTPNVVTSVFVGKALIEYHETFKDDDALKLAGQIVEFILNEMVLIEYQDYLCFRYIPGENAQVHNANLLAASFLSSMKKYGNEELLQNKITKAINFSTADINKDGSWAYGTKPFHRWVDNFHTAFNIESLLNIEQNAPQATLLPVIEKVADYYLNNLFDEKGLPKYYNNKLYPLDIHVIAEVFVVLDKIKKSKINFDKARLEVIENQALELAALFQDKKGYFYFQKYKYLWNKIPYIRWGQAWMFYALSCAI